MVSRYIRKVQPINTKYRKGAVILVNGGETGHIDPAVFAGRDLLKKTWAECCEVLNWGNTSVDEINRKVNNCKLKIPHAKEKQLAF